MPKPKTALTPQEWDKFRRHVQPGCRCHSHLEGFLLENWPYEHFETSIPATRAETPWYHMALGDYLVLLRFQPYKTLEVHRGSVLKMHYWIDDQWHTIDDILALPD